MVFSSFPYPFSTAPGLQEAEESIRVSLSSSSRYAPSSNSLSFDSLLKKIEEEKMKYVNEKSQQERDEEQQSSVQLFNVFDEYLRSFVLENSLGGSKKEGL